MQPHRWRWVDPRWGDREAYLRDYDRQSGNTPQIDRSSSRTKSVGAARSHRPIRRAVSSKCAGAIGTYGRRWRIDPEEQNLEGELGSRHIAGARLSWPPPNTPTFLKTVQDLGQASAGVTPETIADWVDAMRGHMTTFSAGNRVHDLGFALRILRPHEDWSWLNRDAELLHEAGSPAHDKLAEIVDIPEIRKAAIDRLRRIEREPKTVEAALALQDGIIMLLLSYRPLRRRNLAETRLGINLIVDANVTSGSWLCENPSASRANARLIRTNCRSRTNGSPKVSVQFLCCATSAASSVFTQPRSLVYERTKAGHRYEVELPQRLLPWLKLFLEVYRPLMATGPGVDAAWLSRAGTPLTAKRIWRRIRRATEQELGTPITLHRFRDCLASTVSEIAPERIEDAAQLLGHRVSRRGRRPKHRHTAAIEIYRQRSGTAAAARRLAEVEERSRRPRRARHAKARG